MKNFRWFIIMSAVSWLGCAPQDQDQSQAGHALQERSSADVSQDEGSDEDIVAPQPVAGSWLACSRMENSEYDGSCELEEVDLAKMEGVDGQIDWIAKFEDGSTPSEKVLEHIEMVTSEDGQKVQFRFGELSDDVKDRIVIEIIKGSTFIATSQAYGELPKVQLSEQSDIDAVNSNTSQHYNEFVCLDGEPAVLNESFAYCKMGWPNDECPGGDAPIQGYCRLGLFD